MPFDNAAIGDILLKQNYISEEEMKLGQELAEKRKVPLVTVLTEQGLLTQELLDGALAEHYKLPFFDLQSNMPPPKVIEELPEQIARMFSAVIVAHEGDRVTVATSDPSQELLEEAVRLNLGKTDPIIPEKKEEKDEKSAKRRFRFSFGKAKEEPKYAGTLAIVYAPQAGIEAAWINYRKPLATRFQAIIAEEKKVAPEILEEIIRDAIELRASDIHFEPQEKIVIVRFRVDGVMHEAGRIPRVHYEGVVNRVKIEANLRIDEHLAAQDGAIRFPTPQGNLDIRVSIVPIVDGEKIVMRLLAAYVRSLTLLDLGFSEAYRTILTEAAHKPFGMILTTGPTGSGKSTTLSALLKMRNAPDVNISTIEDPVEYKMVGVNHIQVNPKVNLTFASGLRSLVRQDPDIILVGEIRDGETADISVNAALTGHLVFSTLHANDAATAIPRLLDMDVEPFLLASTLEVIIGQRLVRRVCPRCRTSESVPAEEAVKLFPGADRFFPEGKPVTLYHGKGCESCGQTGYRGRVGIYELLVVTPEIEDLIMKRATSSELNEKAVSQGMRLMFDDGFAKVEAGITTIEELLRVAAPPDVIFSKEHAGS